MQLKFNSKRSKFNLSRLIFQNAGEVSQAPSESANPNEKNDKEKGASEKLAEVKSATPSGLAGAAVARVTKAGTIHTTNAQTLAKAFSLTAPTPFTEIFNAKS